MSVTHPYWSSKDAAGKAKWAFKGKRMGMDEVVACYNAECDTSTVEWQFPASVWLNPATASCNVGEPHILRATANRLTGSVGKTDPLLGNICYHEFYHEQESLP
jgi:hypothetical protein